MSDLSGMLNIAKSALLASRYAMDVTSNNIANANTDGYSRQRADLEASSAVKTSAGFIGTGVDVSKVVRIRDNYVDQEIRSTNSDLGQSDIQNKMLDQVESLFNEPNGGGLSTEFDSFFNSFQELAANPEDNGVRETVIQQGVSISKSFNDVASGLDSIRLDSLNSVNDELKQINSLTGEIASLNQQIFSLGANDVNTLKDTRDSRLDELSKLIDVKVNIDSNGLANVSASGSTLVSGVNSLEIVADSNSNYIQLLYKGTKTALSSVGGEIGGQINTFNSIIPKYQGKIDSLASTFITEVNTLHKAGYGLADKTTGVASTGINFFDGTDARSIKVTNEVQSDVTKIAASSDGSSGDNTVAYNIAKVVDKGVYDNGNTTLSQYYRGIVTTLGYENSDAARSVSALDTRVSSLTNLKTSVSGVSLDDEMVNLIQYQRSYEAAGKVVTTVNTLFDTLLGLIK
jgi:flagellar hook-associated protein 1 FlgK